MAIVYDRAITAARRTINTHRPRRRRNGTTCVAGCDAWPCKSFLAAFAVITRNSNTPALR